MKQSAILGKAGEDAAAQLLQKSGMQILARNWRRGSHELDIICMDGETLVFVEVRTRTEKGMLSPLESLTAAKLRHFAAAAQDYMQEKAIWSTPCRFDAVCILRTEKGFETEHLRNVIQLSDFMDCRDSAWQPW